MWIITQDGFYSVTACDHHDSQFLGQLLDRATHAINEEEAGDLHSTVAVAMHS